MRQRLDNSQRRKVDGSVDSALEITKQLSTTIRNKQYSPNRTENQDNDQAFNLRPKIQTNNQSSSANRRPENQDNAES